MNLFTILRKNLKTLPDYFHCNAPFKKCVTNQTLFLASSSPRRKHLLAQAGWKFDVFPAQVDETRLPGESVNTYVLRVAISKARAVITHVQTKLNALGKESKDHLPACASRDRIYVLAADTAVVDGKDVLGKPQDEAEAIYMLGRLRSRIHQVYSGVALACVQPENGFHVAREENDAYIKILTSVCVTDVVLRDYNDEEVTEYVASRDPLDKAGAYAIQNKSFHPARSIKGCYANVVGLPLCHVAQVFEEMGITPPVAGEHVFPICQRVFADDLLCLDCCRAVWQANRAPVLETIR